MADLRASLTALYARVPLGMRLGLAPMRAACAHFGHPERAFDAVHVAGTNGKGSVCAFVERIARAAGKRTGMFTSPHLSRFAERVRVDGEPLADEALTPLLDRVLREAPDLSFFEVATLTAFLAFREAQVDIAIVEVGIGGRLDATNVLPSPRAAAITRVALDHTDRLGPTLADIAREKAGIAKPGLELVLGPMPPDVRAVVDDVARASGATTTSVDDDPALAHFVSKIRLGLPGAHQRANAAIARALGLRIGADDRAIEEGLSRATWPGRLETIETPHGPILLDAAHNPDGADALACHLSATSVPTAETTLVFGALAEKGWGAMLDRLAPCAERRIYVPVRSTGGGGAARAAADPAEMAARHPGEVAVDLADALARLARSPGRLAVVCGSILLVGEARAHLLGLPRDPPVAL